MSGPPTSFRIRPARTADAGDMARIYNQGIAERVATFETNTKSPAELAELIEAGALVLVAEREGTVMAFIKIGPYDDASHYYSGIGEATMYVDRPARRSGAGRALMEAVADAAEHHGYYKLVGKVFTSNAPSIAMVKACGWREVGVHRHHGRLDGEWKDVLVVERLLGDATR
ncbi:MAG TPA: GNAT family N-acetyltransferase [Solirubrobacterales bacterium]|nr:GNAT family N-acetyltransferase [Solirubrobacterales bacterium]